MKLCSLHPLDGINVNIYIKRREGDIQTDQAQGMAQGMAPGIEQSIETMLTCISIARRDEREQSAVGISRLLCSFTNPTQSMSATRVLSSVEM